MNAAQDPTGWGDPVIEEAARRVLDAGLGSGASAIEPVEHAWSASTAADLRSRIIENADEGSGTFMSKLEVQLSGASLATHLLCAELLYLHVLPLTNVGAATKRNRILAVLRWADAGTRLPSELDAALDQGGVFHGGTGFNVQIWNQVGWLLLFVQHWRQQPDAGRAAALTDPWAFRKIVATVEKDQPGIRNSLLYLAFPETFFPIVNQDHKRAIRDAFLSVIGTSSGKDPTAVDRDLLAIRTKQVQETGGAVDYYTEPYRSQWKKPDDEGQRAWLVRPRPAGTDIVAQWRSEELISLPAAHLPAVEPGVGLAEIRALVEQTYQHEDYVRRLELATAFDIFCNRMKIDDIVVTADDDSLHVGQISGEPQRAEGDERFIRSVAWSVADPATVSEQNARLREVLGQRGVIVDLTAQIDALRSLLPKDTDDADSIVAPGPSDDTTQSAQVLSLPAVTKDLAATVHMDQAWLQRIIELLQDRRQIVFHGPPGTGKTYLARKLAAHLAGGDGESVRLVQFHPSYAYEDFFEGYRPDQTESGAVTFRLRPGPLRQLASDARSNPRKPYILIIDEINRGNLSKIFGELYFLLEYRDAVIRLQYSPEEPFGLPDNVFVIGTMNTADRSIALIDAAMRRRFAFVELHPDTMPVRQVLDQWLQAQGKGQDPRARLLEALNAQIGAEDRDYQIGPSYLMTAENERPGGLERVWEYSILPLLEEHFYGRLTRAQIHHRFGLQTIKTKADSQTTARPDQPAPS